MRSAFGAKLMEALLWLTPIAVWVHFAPRLFGVVEWWESFTIVGPIVWIFLSLGIFYVVFGSLPFYHYRLRKQERWLDPIESWPFPTGSRVDDDSSESAAPTPNELARQEELAQLEHERELEIDRIRHIRQLAKLRSLSELASNSKEVANNIRGRAGLFLAGGLIIALTGVGFFYMQTSRTYDNMSVPSILATLAPNVGVLFFVEFVAIFLLRQYRPLMDEYRHYEAIQRRREEVESLFILLAEHEVDGDPIALVKDGHYFSVGESLSSGETTALLEAKKLDRDETLGLLGKLIEALPKLKS